MNSEDGAFNNFIVTSDAEEAEKENIAEKQSKTTSEQFKMIFDFTKDIDETTMTKETYDERWNTLAEKLNNVGPPVRNSSEWRRTWTIHKYNRKRKHSASAKSNIRHRSNHDPVDQALKFSDPFSVQTIEKLDEILHVLKESNGYLKRLVNQLKDRRTFSPSNMKNTIRTTD